MPRGDQLARQWKIIKAIESSKRGKTAAEIARELEAHPRTVYRDLEALQTAGFPLYNDRDNGGSRWKLIETARQQIPIPFSLPELMALYFCRDMISALHDTVFHEALDSLFSKVSATLPPESHKYLKSVQQAVTVGKRHHKDYGTLRDVMSRVTDAAISKRTLRLKYRAMGQARARQRQVDPYRIWFFNGTFYLVGYCHLRKEIRIFVLDRIEAIAPTDATFTVPEDFDFDDMMRGSFGVVKGTPERVRIRFDRKIAGYISERVWHNSQTLSPQDDGAVVFQGDIAVNEELKNWVLSWGAHARVLEPPSLIRLIKEEAARIGAHYRVSS